MIDHEPKAPKIDVNVSAGAESGRYLLVGAFLVVALVGVYFAIGSPGLHNRMSRAPERVALERTPDVTAAQWGATARAMPTAPHQ